MTFSFRRINAIFQKDLKDFSRNMAISITLLFPPILAFFYSRSGVDSIEAYYLIINMVFTMIATFVQACLIAEEKDKDTLRSLMLSPASSTEILIGKSLLSFILTMGVMVLTIICLGYQPENIGIIAFSIVLSSVFYISLGTILGLYAKTVMEASVIVLPVIFLFSFSAFITEQIDDYPFLKVVNYFPNIQLTEIAYIVNSSSIDVGLWKNILVISVWVIFSLVILIIIYRKRTFD